MEDIFIEQIWKQIMEKGLDCISKLDMLDFQSIKNIWIYASLRQYYYTSTNCRGGKM